MLKKLLLLAAIIAFSSCSLSKEEYALRRSVGVAIGSNNPHCSGTIIGEGVILTAAHCVMDLGLLYQGGTNYLNIRFYDGRRSFAVVHKVGNFINDLAIIHTNTYGNAIAKISCKSPKRFSDTHLVGYPAGLDTAFYSELIFADVMKDPFNEEKPLFSLFWGGTWFGFSGSGVYNEDNKLIAVLTAMIGQIVFGMPAESICDFIGLE